MKYTKINWFFILWAGIFSYPQLLLANETITNKLLNFQKKFIEQPGYAKSKKFLADMAALKAIGFDKLVLTKNREEKEKTLLEIVEFIKSSPITPIFEPLLVDLQKNVLFNRFHSNKPYELNELHYELSQVIHAIRQDAWIGGYPAHTELEINRNETLTENNVVSLEIKAEAPKDKITEMAFSENGTVYQPFQPFHPLLNDFLLSDIEGVKKLWVIFKTDKGKIGGVAYDNIYYDKSAPSGEFYINNGETQVTDHKIVMHITAKDAFMEDLLMQIKTTGGEDNPRFVRFQNTFDTYLLGWGGEKELSVTLKDRFGHVSAPIVKRIVLDFPDFN